MFSFWFAVVVAALQSSRVEHNLLMLALTAFKTLGLRNATNLARFREAGACAGDCFRRGLSYLFGVLNLFLSALCCNLAVVTVLQSPHAAAQAEVVTLGLYAIGDLAKDDTNNRAQLGELGACAGVYWFGRLRASHQILTRLYCKTS